MSHLRDRNRYGGQGRRKKRERGRQLDRILRLIRKFTYSREGATLVPLDIHFNDRGRAKVLLGLAEGKKKHDKRAAIAQRDWQRDKARLMREKG